jgi:hypothetical protein
LITKEIAMENQSVPVPPYGQTPPPPKKSNAKTIIIVVGIVAVFCLFACGLISFMVLRGANTISRGIRTNPAQVILKANEIAVYEPPAGFEPANSFELLGLTFVVYENPGNNSAMVVLQMPSQMELTDATIQQMEDQMQNQTGRRLTNVETIDEYETTIRGKPAKVVVQEGEANNQTFRQMLVVFQGKSGLAMIAITGPVDSWDQAAYDDFVDSIK